MNCYIKSYKKKSSWKFTERRSLMLDEERLQEDAKVFCISPGMMTVQSVTLEAWEKKARMPTILVHVHEWMYVLACV